MANMLPPAPYIHGNIKLPRQASKPPSERNICDALLFQNMALELYNEHQITPEQCYQAVQYREIIYAPEHVAAPDIAFERFQEYLDRALDKALQPIVASVARLPTMEADLKDSLTQITSIKADVQDSLTRITNIETRVTNIETRVTNIEADMQASLARITEIEARLPNIETSVRRIPGIKTKLQAVEASVARLSNMERDVTRLHADMTKIRDSVKVLPEMSAEMKRMNGQLADLNKHHTDVAIRFSKAWNGHRGSGQPTPYQEVPFASGAYPTTVAYNRTRNATLPLLSDIQAVKKLRLQQAQKYHEGYYPDASNEETPGDLDGLQNKILTAIGCAYVNMDQVNRALARGQ